MAQLFVVMGVSGSGKTTVGQALAARLGCPFYDGDDFHPPANVAKMASGTPLNDADRAPWLARLAELLKNHEERGETAVLACSALKQKYRDQLRVSPQVQFVYLAGSFDLIWQRMSQRTNHYMKADMLRSQFTALEPPTADEAILIPIEQDVAVIVDQVLQMAGQL
ncbi:MAG: gluconokinase [Ardenticatenaceae bacterium]|nr:gluconokinase [Ardenticatenaceae bacterium]